MAENLSGGRDVKQQIMEYPGHLLDFLCLCSDGGFFDCSSSDASVSCCESLEQLFPICVGCRKWPY